MSILKIIRLVPILLLYSISSLAQWEEVEEEISSEPTEVVSTTTEEEDTSELDEFDERIYEIEKSLEGKFPILPIDAKKIRLGGFLTSTYSHLFNSTGSEGSFNSNRFEILLGADMSKKLSFFTAFGIISESELLNQDSSSRTYGNAGLINDRRNRANKVPLVISHGTYKFHDLLSVKFGRFIAPIGIINIEHFPPGLFLETPPIALRPVPGGGKWGHFLNGLDFFGQKSIESQTIGYHLNISSFSFLGPANPVTGGSLPGGDSTEMILGGRFWVRFLKDRLTLGLSMQSGLGGPNNQTFGSDLLVDWGRFLLKTEWTSQVLRQGGTVSNVRILYVQPSVRLSSTFRAVYRFDWLSKDAILGDQRTEHIVGINWVPNPLLRVRAEYSIIDYGRALDEDLENPDYNRLTLSGVISF